MSIEPIHEDILKMLKTISPDKIAKELLSVNSPDTQERCLHDECPRCHGTGRKVDGSICVHMISCPCPKCSPRC